MDFSLLWFAIVNDWLVLAPILVCSVLTVAVTIERYYFYKKNSRDVVQFIHRLQRELQRGSLENSQMLSGQLGGIIGEVSEEGIRVLAEQPESFERSYDITASLAARKLEKNLPILGTIATICPYLGLFGTVVRILLTFGDLSKAGGQSGAPEIMFGIGSALIATAFGLGVAILAVALNNYFQSIVNRYEDDFQLLKLLFLSFVDERDPMAVTTGQERRPTQQPGY
ncbi:MotA/TolQ/ExbB proton channel family protein [Vampirovibrio sp.]|uniref:MotA/TolQ/ExbB proton channel family protein n=1 Tax=Vampirovibrio sp. TaxID=2717857 RepID=UPI0035944AF5